MALQHNSPPDAADAADSVAATGQGGAEEEATEAGAGVPNEGDFGGSADDGEAGEEEDDDGRVGEEEDDDGRASSVSSEY